MSDEREPLVVAREVRVTYRPGGAAIHAVRGVTLDIAQGETLGVVGESGSGKSVLARTIMGLTATEPRAEVGGSVELDGQQILGRSAAQLRPRWGPEMAMIFQDPLAALNPVRTVGAHLEEPLRLHLGLRRREARRRALELLSLVGIPEPARRLRQYPHELSGGMRQRVMIALAVSCEPKLLIADEPTTALDVTVQRQVLDLIDRLARDLDMATLLITHDLGVVAGRADRIAVMYAGEVVELASTTELFERPQHPYTEALLGSIPRSGVSRDQRLRAIPGNPPDPRHLSAGCPFRDRCSYATDRCEREAPRPREVDGRLVSCHFPLATSAASAARSEEVGDG